MKKILLFCLAILIISPACADEGMWLPSLIGSRIKDMRSKGLRLKAEDIYSAGKASLKDAVVKFGNGCTGEMISASGLLLTNHHCGYGQIQAHSTLSHDYLTNGFWAMSRGEELPNPGLEVSFLVRMDDVTEAMLDGVTDGMDATTRSKAMEANAKKIVDKAIEGTHYVAEVEPFYAGNQYFVFVYEVFTDVRLVGAPPSSIGKFGGDTDNWMWPRHTGDFSLFRVYAGPDNKPAAYSKANIPYRSKKFFSISTRGVAEGDFTFVYGYPARTSQYLTSDAVDFVQNYSDPAKIRMRTMRLDVIGAAQEADPLVRIQYAAKHANIANAWKKWQGEEKGLKRLGTIERKREAEAGFQAWADADPARKAKYGSLLPRMHELYMELRPYAVAMDYYMEGFYSIEMMALAGHLSPNMPQDKMKALADKFYKNYSADIDRRVAARLLGEYLANASPQFIPAGFADEVEAAGGVERYADALFASSVLADSSKFAASDRKTLAADPAIRLYSRFAPIRRDSIVPRYTALYTEIDNLYSTYVQALREQHAGEVLSPDANFTLRVAYGHVEGYSPEDGVRHLHQTTLKGIIEKDNPAIYDYDVPQRLRDLYAAQDYGCWGVDGTVPVAFIATNHTTGGNSGSPVLNGRGELVGVNFDRTWLSTMSDIEFDPAMCRNISLDVRYMLFVIDKIGGAKYLIDEMQLIK